MLLSPAVLNTQAASVMEGSLTLTLEALAPTGAVFTTEQVSAFQYSLPLKKIEAGLSTLQVGELVYTVVHCKCSY